MCALRCVFASGPSEYDKARTDMATDSLVFRTAERHVNNYTRESSGLMAEHREAMDCRDCEAFLQLAIEAFHWLIRADLDLPSRPGRGSPTTLRATMIGSGSFVETGSYPVRTRSNGSQSNSSGAIASRTWRNFVSVARKCGRSSSRSTMLTATRSRLDSSSCVIGLSRSTCVARLPSSFRVKNRTTRSFRKQFAALSEMVQNAVRRVVRAVRHKSRAPIVAPPSSVQHEKGAPPAG